jgi:hypothetical protein
MLWNRGTERLDFELRAIEEGVNWVEVREKCYLWSMAVDGGEGMHLLE